MDIPFDHIIELLKKLIRTSSFSREEQQAADILASFFKGLGIEPERYRDNVVIRNENFTGELPTVLLNSHIDTVKPGQGWQYDPFDPVIEDGKLHGLGSNDAGGALVSLIAAYLHFHDKKELPFNLILAATAEEEISGNNGVELVLHELGTIDLAIVGEPTNMKMAIAEKGLMVLDCYASGKSGHAAREEGENAIYKSIRDIEWFRSYQFPERSELLGPVKMSVTMIESGIQHNVVPDKCHFVVDVRTTDAYTNEETLNIIKEHVDCEVIARSTRLQPSGITMDHPVVKAAKELGIDTFGSPTLSDQALMNFPSVKIGPGDSSRSHVRDEYIFLEEIEEGIMLYKKIIGSILGFRD